MRISLLLAWRTVRTSTFRWLPVLATLGLASLLLACQQHTELNTISLDRQIQSAANGGTDEPALRVTYLPDTEVGDSVDAAFAKKQGWQSLQRINMGVQKEGFWFRVQFQGGWSERSKRFVIKDWRPDRIDAYQISLVSSLQLPLRLFSTGSIQPFSSKPTQERHIVFDVPLDTESRADLLIYVKTTNALQMPLEVTDADDYRMHANTQLMNEALLVGCMLALVLTNLLTFFTSRESVWLSAAALIFTWMLVALQVTGAGYQFLWPDYPAMNALMRAFAPALIVLTGAIFLLQLMSLFLGTDSRVRKPLILFFSGGIVVVAVLAALSLLNPESTLFAIAIRAVSGIYGIALIGLLFYSMSRRANARVLLPIVISYALGSLGFILVTLNKAGLMGYYDGMDNWPLWGTTFNAICITVFSAIRYQAARVAQIKALNQANEASAQSEIFFKLQLEAQQSSQMKTDFLALMSHELRTPMAGIIGMLKLAQRGDDVPEIKERIDQAQNSAESMLDILNDLLDLSKIEAGKLKLEAIDIDFRKEITDALALLRERAYAKSIFFESQIAPEVAPYFEADSTRIRQILLNLIGNAIKFTERGGIQFNVSVLQNEEGTQRLQITIQDTGIGMTEEALSRLFQKFEQADTSTTRRFGGTGLGLSITKQLVELMGGEVSVTSQVGQGSCFIVVLPLKLGAKPVADIDYVPAEAEYSLKVLVAEDVITNQMVIEGLLEELGHQVSIVEDGRAALQALAVGDYDVVLMDGRMPVMDGLTATRHFRTGVFEDLVFKAPDTPVIALTANATELDRDRFLEAGVDRFLTKPIDEAKLAQALAEVTHKHLTAGRALTPRSAATDSPANDPQPAAQELAGLQALDALLDAPPEQLSVESVLAQPLLTDPPGVKPLLRNKMLGAFVKQTPDLLQRATEALERGDANNLAVIVHGIKGGGSYIWPDSPLVQQSARLETLADAGELPAIGAEWADYLALVNGYLTQAAPPDAG